jgi:hypothetical protein
VRRRPQTEQIRRLSMKQTPDRSPTTLRCHRARAYISVQIRTLRVVRTKYPYVWSSAHVRRACVDGSCAAIGFHPGREGRKEKHPRPTAGSGPSDRQRGLGSDGSLLLVARGLGYRGRAPFTGRRSSGTGGGFPCFRFRFLCLFRCLKFGRMFCGGRRVTCMPLARGTVKVIGRMREDMRDVWVDANLPHI